MNQKVGHMDYKVGRELDKLIAEKVFNHKVVKTVWGKEKQYSRYSIGEPDYYDESGATVLRNALPLYSEDIADAWEVVKKLVDQNLELQLHVFGSCVRAYFADLEWQEYEEADTAPHAICKAALKAVTK